MAQLGKMLLFGGLAIAGVGLLLIAGERLGLGRLPGDLVWKRRNTTIYFPWVTSLIVSVILTVLLNVFLRRK
jgi:phosphate/sulfate permease